MDIDIYMAQIYIDLIHKGLKTIDDVPENLLDNVQKLLEESQSSI